MLSRKTALELPGGILATISIETDHKGISSLLTAREEVLQYKIMNSLPVSMDHYYMGVKEVNMEQLEEAYKMKV